ncbi:MAG: RDD family protein [Cytophagaceae bacterium]
MSDESIIDDFSVSSGKRLSTLTISKSAPQVFVDAHGNATESIKDIKIPYVVPTVNAGMRFLYYIIELILFIFISGILSEVVFVELLGLNHLVSEMLSYTHLFLYYFVLESTLGSSIIKEVFGYTVINDFAQKISMQEAAIRAISRYVPFEAFSCLGSPSWGWHDKWAKTYVVKKSDVKNIQLALNKN